MLNAKESVLWNINAGGGCRRMGISCRPEYQQASPGQFVMLGLFEPSEFVLRRPFSIHRLIKDQGKTTGVEILYKVVGNVTRRFSTSQKGDEMDILGPLGKGFSLLETSGRPVFIVGGGIGVAPMLFLAESLLEKKINPADGLVFLGGQSAEDILLGDEFKRLGMDLRISTDDGSRGQKGFVTEALEAEILKNPPAIIYACGPPGMLKRVSEISEKYAAPCQVSMETMMACGMGACMGCAASHKTEDRYWHMCLDGPVFDPAVLKM